MPRKVSPRRLSLPSRIVKLLVRLIVGASCAFPASAAEPILVADPSQPLAQMWTHHRFVGETDYEGTKLDGVAAIRAIGRNSASGLYREFSYRISDHPWLEWMWRVEYLQQTADIRVKEREDFAAAIFLIFGRPSAFKRDVPTLAYVWTGDHLADGTIIDSVRHPGVVRYVVTRNGAASLGQWVRERRNVLNDFRVAFGHEPPELVQVVALFTDNDQTREPVESYYGAVRALHE